MGGFQSLVNVNNDFSLIKHANFVISANSINFDNHTHTPRKTLMGIMEFPFPVSLTYREPRRYSSGQSRSWLANLMFVRSSPLLMHSSFYFSHRQDGNHQDFCSMHVSIPTPGEQPHMWLQLQLKDV